MKRVQKSLTAVCVLASVLSSQFVYCESEQDAGSIRAMIKEIETEIQKLEKENPRVYYVEKDTSVNIHKKLKGAIINHKFMCPYHKGFSYVGGEVPGCLGNLHRGRPVPCKAIKFYNEWKKFEDQIEKTKQCDDEICAAKGKLLELHQKLRATTGGSQKTISQQEGQKVIRIKRSTIDKLLQDGEVSSPKLKLILVDE